MNVNYVTLKPHSLLHEMHSKLDEHGQKNNSDDNANMPGNYKLINPCNYNPSYRKYN